ncbi:SigE family RNA polymerase sigma factor [Solicola gregarius]|uniref:SigE family RNA polymerase sigma factor n=1 Tax=Solicola gregarius TaxID=2908642 RepID=A0AA46TN62_9ACTN|nr:SigE family RNA polymerase sigma factor [Solicola gregarius]UYM07433.1 SigE family RNA polymerase sigma factor [Solicola gregarius]
MSTKRTRDADFVEFVASRRRRLLTAAYFRCGDWHQAEDLVQTALARLYVAWPKVVRRGAEDAYVRRIIFNLSVDASRSPARRERLVEVMPETPAPEALDISDTSALMAALADLSERQRTVIVLRYWLQLSVDETAHDLGVSPGTVKSQCARAMAKLRTALAPTYDLTTVEADR